MKLRRYVLVVAVGCSLCWSGLAFAQDQGGPNPEELYKKLDKNADGVLTAEEVPEEQSKFFDRAVRVGDKNDDGKLTKDEFVNGLQQERRPAGGEGNRDGAPGRRPEFDPKQMFERMDRNKDGKLTKDEIPEPMRERFAQAFERLGKEELTQEDFVGLRDRLGAPGDRPQPGEFFSRLDTNGDGKVSAEEAPERGKQIVADLLRRAGKQPGDSLSKEEFIQLAAQGGGRPDAPRPEGRPNPEGVRRPGEGPGGFRGPLIFRKLDKDENGRISKEELASAVQLFDELDGNKDGGLEPRELFGTPPGEPGGQRPEGRPTDRPRRPEGENPDNRPRRPEGENPDGRRPRAEGDRRSDGPSPPEDVIRQNDKNDDGKLSKEEAPDRLKERFSEVDANKDGTVDRQELESAFAKGRDRQPRSKD